jgi:hypothetical protein
MVRTTQENCQTEPIANFFETPYNKWFTCVAMFPDYFGFLLHFHSYFSKIIRQRKSSNWMHQIGSMLRELLLTIFLTGWRASPLNGAKETYALVKDEPKNLYNEKYDAQVEVIGKAVMIVGHIMLFSIFWTQSLNISLKAGSLQWQTDPCIYRS